MTVLWKILDEYFEKYLIEKNDGYLFNDDKINVLQFDIKT